jgi:hypothetical protein
MLEQAQSFAATISGFGTGDTIDATNFLKTGTTFNFVENSGVTGGTLTLNLATYACFSVLRGSEVFRFRRRWRCWASTTTSG